MSACLLLGSLGGCREGGVVMEPEVLPQPVQDTSAHRSFRLLALCFVLSALTCTHGKGWTKNHCPKKPAPVLKYAMLCPTGMRCNWKKGALVHHVERRKGPPSGTLERPGFPLLHASWQIHISASAHAAIPCAVWAY